MTPRLRALIRFFRALHRPAAVTLGVMLSVMAGCAHRQPLPSSGACAVEVVAALSPAIPAGTRQLLVVVPLRPDATRGELVLFERRDGGWFRQGGPLPVMVGRNGFARPGEKREGDGRTPAGLFPLESAFGYAAAVATDMPYRQATDDDLWVDDVHAPDYNRWVRRGTSAARSFEEMKRSDHRYRYGLVTGYNRYPTVPGLGSAIFLHVWQEEGSSTSGCVALAEPDMVAILRWLDPGKQPLILMGDPRHLPLLPGWSGSASAPARCEP